MAACGSRKRGQEEVLVAVEEGRDRRKAERVRVCCKLEIVASPDLARPAAEPALSVDISSTGLCANTPHHLKPGEEVEVVINTAEASGALGIPANLRARAHVCRVEMQAAGWRKVSLVFAPAFAQSMEIAFYVAYLCGMKEGGGAAPAMA